MSLESKKTLDGDTAFDGTKLFKATANLLAHLAALSAGIREALQHDCGSAECKARPAIALDEEAIEGFGTIFRAAAAVQAALHESVEAARGFPGGDSDSHGLGPAWSRKVGPDCISGRVLGPIGSGAS